MQDQVTRLWDEGTDAPRKGGMVSCTQLQAYLSCPRRWSYSYVEGLRPRTERPYLTVGKLIHKGFEAAMRLRAEGCEDVQDMVETGVAAIEAEGASLGGVEFEGDRVRGGDDPVSEACGVFWEALPEFDPTRWDVMRVGGVPALELHFITPCPHSEGLHGYVDAVSTRCSASAPRVRCGAWTTSSAAASPPRTTRGSASSAPCTPARAAT